ncbi:MAG: hypothetical protein IKA17_01185 [Clostridia bacterium]|nr:hypothetical protein [Clostridia bacterium]
MKREACFLIDDTIWVFRDLTRERPKSMFDNPFLALLKEAHDKYGMKVQLNCFYRTDFFYGEEEFTLADMTDAYKKEWEEASDWLRLAFHAKQEFPDYPYINADYDDVKRDFDALKKEVVRFAGEKAFAKSVLPHWMPISKDAVRALYDGGIKVLCCSAGEKREYNGDPNSLPYGHAARLLHNRKPETMLYQRGGLNKAIDNSICGYNHITTEERESILYNTKTIPDEETKMRFALTSNAPCLNLCDEEYLVNGIKANVGKEYIGHVTHEQYFYKDYYNYQPDYGAKVLAAARTLWENGYTYIFFEEHE